MLSKTLERLVARQLVDYLSERKLLLELQSAYRAYHSTETAVLRVLSHTFEALDRGDWAALTLLDLSTAFDTVDHTTLILVLRGTTVLPRHRGTIFLRYQYRRLYGTI